MVKTGEAHSESHFGSGTYENWQRATQLMVYLALRRNDSVVLSLSSRSVSFIFFGQLVRYLERLLCFCFLGEYFPPNTDQSVYGKVFDLLSG